MQVLLLPLLTVGTSLAITTSPIETPASKPDPSRKEKRGIFGLGAYAPAAPVYGHAFAHAHAHAHAHAFPAPAVAAPLPLPHFHDGVVVGAAVPPSGPLGPFLGAHAHTHSHTVVTKKIGIPIPQPYAVPVEKPYPVPVKVIGFRRAPPF